VDGSGIGAGQTYLGCALKRSNEYLYEPQAVIGVRIRREQKHEHYL
jgi:hypothetical protein